MDLSTSESIQAHFVYSCFFHDFNIFPASLSSGQSRPLSGYPLKLKQPSVRLLSTLTTLFARHLATDIDSTDEELLLAWVAAQLQALDIRPRKLLFGTEHFIVTPSQPIRVRSLMIADLEVEESLRLQQHGLGPHRHLGCGVFIPHKDIKEIRK